VPIIERDIMNQSVAKVLIAAPVLAAGLGCLNPFTNSYRASLTKNGYRMGLEPGTVEVVRTEDADKSTSEWLDKAPAWVVVGTSVWTGQDWLDDQAVDQAKSVGATLVFVESKRLNTQLAYLPVTTPTSSITYSSGTINSPAGSANYSGTASTYGTQTTYVPYERVTMQVKACFLAMRKPASKLSDK
jgi:hypothetical protein